jgi:hypothetical protein
VPRIHASISLALAALACAGVPCAFADPVRLELRIVPQSGVPGVLCVYDDPPTPLGTADPPREAWASPNIARRFEVQYRLIDTDASDGVSPAGLQSATLNILAASSTAGLWGRALLSISEGQPDAAAASTPPEPIDCSGLPIQPALRPRGLHQPFRTLLTGADPSEDTDNGAFSPAGLSTIAATAAGPPHQQAGAWFGLYTFEFTPSATFTGSLTITAASAPSLGAAYRWYDTLGVIHPVAPASPPTSATITVRVPASAVACCTRGRCTIALTPSACFASAGFVAAGNTCGPTPQSTCCFADFNRDGVLGVQDLFDFLIAYQRGSLTADVNGSGMLTIQDVFDYLAAYFLGCDS